MTIEESLKGIQAKKEQLALVRKKVANKESGYHPIYNNIQLLEWEVALFTKLHNSNFGVIKD